MFAPKKCGIRYEPPTLILEYVVVATGKVHRRSMPLRDLAPSSDPTTQARKLKNSPKHGKYLEKVTQDRLVRVLGKCVKYLKGASAITAGAGRARPVRLDLSGDDLLGTPADMDMNKLPDSELAHEKSKMSRDFADKQIKPGDAGYEYEKEVDFGEGNLGAVEWDEDEDEESDFSF